MPSNILFLRPHNCKRQKKHINIFNINFLAPTQNPQFWAPRKKKKTFMRFLSWEPTQKRDPHKLFRGDFLGQKGGPKRAIFGHKMFSFLCVFFLPLNWSRLKPYYKSTITAVKVQSDKIRKNSSYPFLCPALLVSLGSFFHSTSGDSQTVICKPCSENSWTKG